MALDFKNIAANQAAARTNRILRSGALTKVAGNILGSALGSSSPVNSIFSSINSAPQKVQ